VLLCSEPEIDFEESHHEILMRVCM